MASGKELFSVAAVKTPTVADLEKLSDELGFNIAKDDLPHYKEAIHEFLQSYDIVDKMPEPTLPVKYARTPGYKPQPVDNPLNAWEWRCDIKGADDGLLSGLTVGIKNNIAVAGVPMTIGSKLLSGFTADIDATVVTRILDQGGRIIGMTTCEDLCFSAASFTTVNGPVLNPHDKTRSTGGSSGGSAALVANGDVDVALGCDQGGSVRIPSSWCGVVGLKPTWGMVPYTGIAGIHSTVDHVGPIAKTVQRCALLLEAIAGYDNGRDPRQTPGIKVQEYSKLVDGKVGGMKVAMIEEGFDNCEADVQQVVRSAADSLSTAGIVVETISFPAHKKSLAAWSVICFDGFYSTLMRCQGVGSGQKGFYWTALADTLAPRMAAEPHHLGEPVKAALLTSRFVEKNYHNRFYPKAQNIVCGLVKEYDELFKKYDAIIMPTLPYKAPKLPTVDSNVKERVKIALGMVQNTGAFDVTGHPAITVPAGDSEGLSVGMMIVGDQFQELKILQIARAWEKIRNGK